MLLKCLFLGRFNEDQGLPDQILKFEPNKEGGGIFSLGLVQCAAYFPCNKARENSNTWARLKESLLHDLEVSWKRPS